jgi:Secretion system C-terminal sorting domain
VHTFTLGLKALLDEYEVELEDRHQRQLTNLETGDYKVTINNQQPAEGRFFLHLKSHRIKRGDQLRTRLYSDDQRHINAELIGASENIESIVVYDLTGRVVLNADNLSGKKVTIDAALLRAGIYIVSVQTEIGVANGKILMN